LFAKDHAAGEPKNAPMRFVTTLAGLLMAGTLAGCGTSGGVRDGGWMDRPVHLPDFGFPPLTTTSCPGLEQPGSSASFTLALPGDVVPGSAPLPRYEAERHLFGSCYETLVRINCEGMLEAGLARSWQAYDRGRVWVFILREDARFWNGQPLGAIHVIDAWRRAEELCLQAGEPSPFLRFQPRGASLEVLGPRMLAIHLHTPDEFFPALLSHPALGVAGEIDDTGWPVGSGPLKPLGPPQGDRLILAPAPQHPDAPAWPRLEIVLFDDHDPDDAPILVADALVTRLRDTASLFAHDIAHRTEPLPWDRTYYIIVPTEEMGIPPHERRRWTSGWEPMELAREVSHQDARPASFFRFEPLSVACPVLPPAVPVLDRPPLDRQSVSASRDVDLIIWPDSDPDAGILADRIAARASRFMGAGPERPGTGPLTRPPEPQPGVAPESVSVPGNELAAHVQAARVGAYILPWPHRWAPPCDELGRMLMLAEWLVDVGFEQGPNTRSVPPSATPARPTDDPEPPLALAVARRLERSQTVQPLLDTRAVLVRDEALVGLRCNHDGSLRLWTGGWRHDPTTATPDQ
jgi:hypothetical protein